MDRLDLADLAALTEKQGWAEANGDLAAIRRQANYLGWQEIPVRRGDPETTILRPTAKEDAQARSLSAQYGLGAQPLHTDGAHLADPPDFVVLFAEEPNETPDASVPSDDDEQGALAAVGGTEARHVRGTQRPP